MFSTTQRAIETRPPLAQSPKLIRQYHFTNRHLPHALQYDAWRDMVQPIMELDAEPSAAGYAVEIKAWDLGRLALTRSTTPPATFHRDTLHIRSKGLDHWCFVAVKTGSVETTRPGRTNQIYPGTLFIKSLHSPLAGSKTETSGLCIFVPRDFCRERVGALDAADDTVLCSGLGRLLAAYLVDLDRQLRRMTEDEIPSILAATHAMIDACIAPTPDRLADASAPINATLLERARELVQTNLLSPTLGVDEICRTLGISRSRLYRLFEDLGGVVHYIRSRRLLDAHRVLSAGTDNRPIVNIAAERDFLDPADFSRAFKREFGYSPREVRLGLRPPSQPQANNTEPVGTFADLLYRLH
ncbi:transcriptional regulator, AraC family [Devosia sp. YR412]|uniref:helix-turn-helix domain-containing protein n=1 Tax=Devosia sp. YR412 TaxID=1881030 RepID=UPI0008BD2AF9|nr:helix-turn-helix domain-containing protein [Devosia sp. YR412]SEQ41441.1 transcriptional regulator, AraC family [Devosia sp. YR412]